MRFTAILIVAAAFLATPALAGSGRPASDQLAVHYYLSLGDSLAAGEQLPSDQNFGDEGYSVPSVPKACTKGAATATSATSRTARSLPRRSAFCTHIAASSPS